MVNSNHSAEHTALVNKILLSLAKRGDCKAWKAQCGSFRSFGDHRRIVSVGLPGMSDIMAVVAPHGRLLCIEVKTGSARQNSAQEAWEKAMKRIGAVYGVARSVDDATELADDAKKNIPLMC